MLAYLRESMYQKIAKAIVINHIYSEEKKTSAGFSTLPTITAHFTHHGYAHHIKRVKESRQWYERHFGTLRMKAQDQAQKNKLQTQTQGKEP